MKPLLPVLALLILLTTPAKAGKGPYLTPFDFGLKALEHGRIDYAHTPPNILCGNFNSDCYPDIARFQGNRLEIYIFQGQGYSARPQEVKTFSQPIKSLRHDDFPWDNVDNLVVELEDGTEETFYHRGGCLDLRENQGFLPTEEKVSPPRTVSDFDFQLVWESEPRPYGMNRVAVGDLDNDGINELVTWWKESMYADSAFILIYKSMGDNQYDLSMEEPFSVYEDPNPYLTFLLIGDVDQNGQKELIFTLQYCYFWEFSAPGVYTSWRSNFTFARPVTDVKITDVDQDGIPEIASVGNYSGWIPPCAYQVEEYYWKSSYPYPNYAFSTITCMYQDWIDGRMSVGDLDNDEAMDIVSGNFGYVWSYDPVDIQYFRYDSTNAYNFTQHWLQTGVPLSCSTPLIGDLDSDGENELFAGGLYPQGGSAFIWKPTGAGTGYIAWVDTTSLIFGPNESTLGFVDGDPSVLSLVIYWMYVNNTLLYLFGSPEEQYSCVWQSAMLDSIAGHTPAFLDMDQDGKMNFALAATIYNSLTPDQVFDWEQTTAGVEIHQDEQAPSSFELHPNFPNPFNSSTMITYSLSATADVKIEICNLLGQTIFLKEFYKMTPGQHQLTWNPANPTSGVYLIRLVVNEQQKTRKSLLMK